tara:strand:- start:184 stop:2529 length:2346 start_codon:yes stop_codon:yes gene_type:complete
MGAMVGSAWHSSEHDNFANMLITNAKPSAMQTMLALFLPLACLHASPQAEPGFQPELTPQGLFRSAGDGLAADGGHWQARFDRNGARINVAHPVESTLATSVTLRLADYGRAGFVRQAANVVPHQRDHAALRYRHGGITEHYRVEEAGFEQSFVLQQRPSGTGDFVIGITAQGDGLEVPRRAAAHQAIEFRHHGHSTVRYGEAFVFERGGSPIEIATRSDGNGRIELIVPGTFLDEATYPVIVDPAVGPVFLPGGVLGQDSLPDVAQSREGYYLFVWQRTFANLHTDIRARLYRRNGTPVTGIVSVTTTGNCRNPSVCASGRVDEMWAVAYEDGFDVVVKELTTNTLYSNPYDTGLLVSGNKPPHTRDQHPSISGGFGNVHVAFDRTHNGVLVPSQILATEIWGYTTRVAGPPVVVQTVTSGHVRRPRLPKTLQVEVIGTWHWLRNRLVWERYYSTPAPGDYDLQTAAYRTRESVFVVTSAPTYVPGNNVGASEVSPDIALVAANLFDPNAQYLIAWEDEGDIHAHRYSYAGALGNEIVVRATANHETGPAVGGGFCEFSVGYLESTPSSQFAINVRAARVLLDGTVAIAGKAIDVLNGPFQHGLRASSWNPGTETTSNYWVNSVMFAWTGQTGFGGIDDIRARRFDPVAANTNLFGAACPGPNGELPMIGTNGEPIPGNGDLEFTVDDAPPGSIAALLIGDNFMTSPLPGAPGCQLYMGTPVLTALSTTANFAGVGKVAVPIPCGVTVGSAFAFQWIVMTPGHNAAGWITSNDMDVSWTQ